MSEDTHEREKQRPIDVKERATHVNYTHMYYTGDERTATGSRSKTEMNNGLVSCNLLRNKYCIGPSINSRSYPPTTYGGTL